MARRFARIVREELAVLLSHGDEELVDGHGGVDGDFASEESFYFVFFYGFGSMLREEPSEAFDTHCIREGAGGSDDSDATVTWEVT